LRVLIIRRDNIGDLVCSTPMLSALRQKYPDAYIAMLVSSYNVEILNGNPDLDEVLIYIKRNQNRPDRGRFSLWFERIGLILKIRRMKFDVIILANGGWRYARKLGARKMIGFRDIFRSDRCQPDIIVHISEPTELHEVEKMALLASAVGADDAPGPLRLFPDEQICALLRHRLKHSGWKSELSTVAIHISQRSELQRWPEQNFVKLLCRLTELHPDIQFLLLWAPGSSDEAIYPGDDERAGAVRDAYKNRNLYPVPTSSVSELVAACSLCNYFVGSDGGAMHIAAGLGKPVLCFFGGVSNVSEWHPWHVPYRALTDETRLVSNIPVDAAISKFNELFYESVAVGGQDTNA